MSKKKIIIISVLCIVGIALLGLGIRLGYVMLLRINAGVQANLYLQSLVGLGVMPTPDSIKAEYKKRADAKAVEGVKPTEVQK